MKNIEDQEDLLGKKVLLRLDLNVPLQDGVIKDETRINKILPTLKFLIQKQTKIIIISHVGRPKGKIDSSFVYETNLHKSIGEIESEDKFNN
jgi:phosphoglycerate kinase